VPSIPGCVSQGKTRGEALANICEAIAADLEVRAEHGLPLTVETQLVGNRCLVAELPTLSGHEMVEGNSVVFACICGERLSGLTVCRNLNP